VTAPPVRLTPEQALALAELAENANEKLESAGQGGANRAFNLGCTLTLVPAAILVGLVFLLSRGNWVMAAVVAFLAGMTTLILANYAAYQARNSAILRTYQRDIHPEIERTLNRLDLPRPSFDRIAYQRLPNGAALLAHLPPQEPDENNESEEDEAASSPD